MDMARLGAVLAERRAPAFRLEQLRQAVFQAGAGSYDEVGVWPAELREAVAKQAPLMSVELKKLSISSDRKAYKAVLTLDDGKAVETVLLRPSQTRWTTCISSQVGCAIGCSFCATGLMGFARDLTPEEIADQVLFWRQYMAKEGLEGRLSNVVYMGMGEPFAAYEPVAQSLRWLMDQKLFGIGARHISVSTSGLVPQIERFGEDFPQVNLALSLHAANDPLRTKLVPLNKAYPLEKLSKGLQVYLSKTNRKIFLEYVMLEGENDQRANASELAAWIDKTGPRELLHVNLIVFNPTDTPHRGSSEEQARTFQAWLADAGVVSTVRQNLGRDIDGACGQLLLRTS